MTIFLSEKTNKARTFFEKLDEVVSVDGSAGAGPGWIWGVYP
jgi:hypothetical protein